MHASNPPPQHHVQCFTAGMHPPPPLSPPTPSNQPPLPLPLLPPGTLLPTPRRSLRGSWPTVNETSRLSLARCADSRVPPPKLAFCIAGSARTFATPLVTTLLRANWLDQLSPRGGAHSFVYLKSRDSEKPNSLRTAVSPASYFRAHTDSASALGALVAAVESLRPRVAEALLLNGSGAFLGAGWRPALDGGSAWRAVRTADEVLWRRYASARCPVVNRSLYPDDNSEERLLHSLLGIAWCAKAIERHELLHGAAYDAVGYTRPDLVRWTPMPPYCMWNFAQEAAVCSWLGMDGTWVVGRNHLGRLAGQAQTHASCEDERRVRLGHGRETVYSSCCFGAEPLLEYVLSHPTRLRRDRKSCATGDWSLVRQIQRQRDATIDLGQNPRLYYHICDVALSNMYDNPHWAGVQESILGLTLRTGRNLRKLFGMNGSKECHAALAPLQSSQQMA